MSRRFRRTLWLLRRAVIATHQDGCFGIAKAAAYSGLVSFIPVLTATAALLVQFNAERVSRIISEFLFIAVPPGTEDLVQYSFTLRGERPKSLLIVATLVSVWAASGLMATLMEGFQAAYRLPSGRPFLQQRLVAIFLVFIAAAPVLIGSLLIILGDYAERWVIYALGVIPRGEAIRGWIVLVSSSIRYLTALAAIVAAAAGLFYYGPNRKQQWSRVWPGAMMATALWMISTFVFTWYVRNVANYNVMYGSVGAVIALLVWMYVLAVVALLGCEYNAERERLLNHSD